MPCDSSATSVICSPRPFSWNDAVAQFGRYHFDYADVKGQEMAKRAATVAAAGGHHLLMVGSLGTGEPEDIENAALRRSFRAMMTPIAKNARIDLV